MTFTLHSGTAIDYGERNVLFFDQPCAFALPPETGFGYGPAMHHILSVTVEEVCAALPSRITFHAAGELLS